MLVNKIVFIPRKHSHYRAVKFNGISGIWINKMEAENILFFHGNAALASEAKYDEQLLKFASKHRMGIFAVDPSGYGISDSEPTLENIKVDAEKAADYISGKVIVWGVSMGGAYAIRAASKLGDRCSRLVLRSTFGHLFDCGGIMGVIGRKLFNDYSNCDVNFTNKDLPIDIYHSSEDLVIPFSSAENLCESLRNRGMNNVTFTRIDGGHNSPIYT